MKLFKSQAPLFIQSLHSYLDIGYVLSSLTISEEVSEHDYTTQAALAVEKKYQLIFTLYSEGAHSLSSDKNTQKILEDEYLYLGFLYLWCHELVKTNTLGGEKKNIQIKASALVYGAEVFFNFFRRNVISAIVEIYRVLTNLKESQDTLHLLRV